jgi:RHS repeat-associated protein
MNISEEKNASGTVTKRYFGQGVQIGGTNYYYTWDHLGSIREMTTGTSGTVVAEYDYDPYGRQTQLSGTMSADFGYTGLYVHQPSGLDLSMYRPYLPPLGRWGSRDPIAERGGINLYEYVRNRSLDRRDPTGLDTALTQWTPTPCAKPYETRFIQVILSGNPLYVNAPAVDNGNVGSSNMTNSKPFYPSGSLLSPGYPTSPMTDMFLDQPDPWSLGQFEVCRVCYCKGSGKSTIGPCVKWSVSSNDQNLADLPSTQGPSPDFLDTLNTSPYQQLQPIFRGEPGLR